MLEETNVVGRVRCVANRAEPRGLMVRAFGDDAFDRAPDPGQQNPLLASAIAGKFVNGERACERVVGFDQRTEADRRRVLGRCA